jgi:hypothetical protein
MAVRDSSPTPFIRHNVLPPSLILIAALLTLFETHYFASQQPGYNHVANTVSELGETGALHAHQVAFGFFLPVGLLVWLALWLVHREASEKNHSLALIGLSCLGTGYALSAFFPCDHGAPFFGTWRTQVHNVLGFVDYAGTGFGFLLISRYFAKRNATVQAIVFLIGAALLFSGLALLMTEMAFHIRGAVQRVTEIAQFTGVFFACFWLPGSGGRQENAPAN